MSGRLSRDQFAHVVRRLVPMSDGEIACLLEIFDRDENGFIEYAEFVRFVGSSSPHIKPDDRRKAAEEEAKAKAAAELKKKKAAEAAAKKKAAEVKKKTVKKKTVAKKTATAENEE